jgi:hypothetical protein
MSNASLDGVWAKLNRAGEHIDTLADAIGSFINADPQPLALSVPYLDPDDGWHTVYGIVDEEPPERLGVILGDVLHNIRSALDHLIWQLVILDGGQPKGGPRGNAFCISMKVDHWDAAQTQHLAGVSGTHQDVIEKTQPFKQQNPDRTPFGWLRFLADTDKHQVVHPVLAAVGDDPTGAVSFKVTKGHGVVAKEEWWHGFFGHGVGIVRCKVEPMTPDTEVEMTGNVKLRIAFSERRAPETLPKLLLAAAEALVRDLEPAFAD